MNRDERNAFGRALVSILCGSAILGALGDLLGWWIVGLIFAAGIVDEIRCTLAVRTRWTRL